MKNEMYNDIKRDSRLLRILPARWRPYAVLARVDRPAGTWLLLLPGLWAIMLAGGGVIDVRAMALFAIGALVMRSAGCVINDLWDRRLDAQVERTRARPLASGEISRWAGFVFLFVLLLAGLLILLQFNALTIMLGMASLPLVVLYPLMKRVTWWPQAFLGLVFNFGALMGWSAVAGTVGWQALCLYAGGILWTLAYDTIYAHQDIEDDALVGIRSTARLFGERSRYFVCGFYAASWLAAVPVTGLAGAAFLLPAAGYAAWMLQQWDEVQPQSCLRTFQRSRNYGLLLLAGFVADILFF